MNDALLRACRDPNLFGPWFRDPATWRSWFVFIRALFGLPLQGEDDLELFTRCTGRAVAPTSPASEAWLICGRRSGKSFILALLAVYLACFRDWRPHLTPGERATVMAIATDRRQSRVVMRYIAAMLTEVPMLAALVERGREGVQDMSFDLQNRVTIEVHTASFRTIRGYTCCAALLDEMAFWRSEESANPDTEVLDALRPALATVPGSLLLAASSPYSRRGALWDAHRRHFAKDGPVLIWQADTRTMNPTVPQRVIDEAIERDPVSAASEWLAEFRTDLESFVDRLAVEACVELGVRERGPISGLRYRAFCDPSGGRQDAMTLAIAHAEGEAVVLDLVRERKPPFAPSSLVAELAVTLKAYGVTTVVGDRYGGEWPAAEFRRSGITYTSAEKSKSDLYRELLPRVNSRRLVLLDDAHLIAQLVGLERRVGRGGKDSIDHPPGMHDDVANAVAGVADLCGRPPEPRSTITLVPITIGAGAMGAARRQRTPRREPRPDLVARLRLKRSCPAPDRGGGGG